MILDIIDEKNPKDHKGQTPLHIAAKSGCLSICTLILGFATTTKEINIKDNYGNSALSLAENEGHEHICQTILAYQSWKS